MIFLRIFSRQMRPYWAAGLTLILVLSSCRSTVDRQQTDITPLLPGEQIWNGVSSFIFGTNNTYNWSADNLETNSTTQQLLKAAKIPLIRTWFFSPDNPYSSYGNLGTDAETDRRLQVDQTIGAACLGVLQDTRPESFNYYQHLVQYVGNRCLIYEFGNEPGANGAPDLSSYIQYWNTEIPVFRKINPSAVFCGPVNDVGDIQTFLTATKQSGIVPDCVSFHDYNHDPAAFGQEITQAKQIAQSILGYQIPVGITEFNYDCCNSFNPDDQTFETQYWTAVYNGLIKAHADFATEFDTFNNGGLNPLDMFDSNAQPRGVYEVMKNLISQYISGASPSPSTP